MAGIGTDEVTAPPCIDSHVVPVPPGHVPTAERKNGRIR